MKAKRFNSSCLCLQTRRADRILTQLYDSFIKPTGLKSTQYGLLRCINNLHHPCLADISATMCMDQTTVSRNIAKLEKGGFISTSPAASDPRKTDIIITQYGREKMKDAEMAWEKAQQTVKRQMGKDDFEQLYSLLNKIAEVVEYNE